MRIFGIARLSLLGPPVLWLVVDEVSIPDARIFQELMRTTDYLRGDWIGFMLHPLLASLLVPFGAEFFHLGLHAGEQRSRINSRDTQPLELQDFALLTITLAAAISDILPEVVDVHVGN